MLSFDRDLRIFAPQLGDSLPDVAHQVAAVDRLPTMAHRVTLGEAKAHLLEVTEHLLGETHYQDEGLGLHTLSVCSRSMKLAAAFACEDVAAERQGRPCILSADEWRAVHRAILEGGSGEKPVLRRNGTFRPARWAVDLIQLTGRLAEVGFGPAEDSLRRRALAEPSREERQAATAHMKSLIAKKEAWLEAEEAEHLEEAQAWIRYNRAHLAPKPRPRGHLDVDGVVHVWLPPHYRTPEEAAAAAEERRARERQAAGQTKVVAGRVQNPTRVDAECHAILKAARRQAAEFARGSRGGRRAMMT